MICWHSQNVFSNGVKIEKCPKRKKKHTSFESLMSLKFLKSWAFYSIQEFWIHLLKNFSAKIFSHSYSLSAACFTEPEKTNLALIKYFSTQHIWLSSKVELDKRMIGCQHIRLLSDVIIYTVHMDSVLCKSWYTCLQIWQEDF